MCDSIALPDLKFKGERIYIHGTDLFVSVTQSLMAYKSGYLKEMSFRCFGDRQCAITFSAPNYSNGRTICQGFWHDCENSSDIKFWVVENGDSIFDRYEFDEDALCSGVEVCGGNIFNPFNPEFSMIENIVALTKRFHNTKYRLETGKWVFGQIVLNERLPDSSSHIQIENYQNIKNRFSRNRIVLDGHLVGEIRFIVA